ncbi:MAG: hypothetical protein K6343_00685 [Caldisericaceae bacterium]
MRRGYALVLVTIIITLMIMGLINSVSVWLRTHALELNETSGREVALYVAQYGINEMIYNINNGTAYSDGASINGTTPNGFTYTATYYQTDTFGGSAYIKGEGTAYGYTRVIYASIISLTSSDFFKYNLYTREGNYTKTNSNVDYITFYNSIYGQNYFYNTTSGVLPDPQFAWYTNPNNYLANVFRKINSSNTNYNFNLDAPLYNKRVVFINYTGNSSTATLTVNFNNLRSNKTLSIITNYPNVYFQLNLEQLIGTQITWSARKASGGKFYPLFLHVPKVGSGSVYINLDYSQTDTKTIIFEGLFYTKSPVTIEYGGSYWGFLKILGQMLADSLLTDWDYYESFLGIPIDINGDGLYTTETIFDYVDYHSKLPKPFSSTGGTQIEYMVGTYREEY